MLALREAMNNKEEPSVLQRINDEENSELLFMLDAFSYQVSNFLDFIDFPYVRKNTWKLCTYNSDAALPH